MINLARGLLADPDVLVLQELLVLLCSLLLLLLLLLLTINIIIDIIVIIIVISIIVIIISFITTDPDVLVLQEPSADGSRYLKNTFWQSN